ncbi:hypothetical protein K469DRAFT_792945 [Zopfia rhizophila CBS 207.26]|uniref:DNA-binding protein RAP1 n=1 Tax=Zopfia rhizophila CBS 207.26 TaxID=1314779 RepID=A0A6A6DSA4_9PEZI|nr:hypothetical protein K469DRAFT_792945 [Zopfia rhizophila CBS 207.26]
MAASIVYDDVADDTNFDGQLFAGKKFWIAQRCPTRNRYLDLIKSNGGQIVLLEKLADFMIADHFRRDCPPGSLSYTFIDKSIENGEIENPEDHPAGPAIGSVRDAGSTRPARGGRMAFTADDDRVLYNWVHDYESKGGFASGNEIYKQLEAVNPRHTWQSWRDRYVKQLRDRPPSAFIPANPPPSPPLDHSSDQMTPKKNLPKKTGDPKRKSPAIKRDQPAAPDRITGTGKARKSEEYTVDDFENLFDKADWEELYANVPRINDCSVENYLEGWEKWAEGTSQTAEQWRQYFEKVVRPQWKQDPQWKKERIKVRVEKRHAEDKTDGEGEVEGEVQGEGKDVLGVDGPRTPKGKGRAKRDNSLSVEGTTSKPNSGKAGTLQNLAGQASSSVVSDLHSVDALLQKFMKERAGKRVLSAYQFFVQDRQYAVLDDKPGLDYTELHKILTPQWDKLPEGEKAPYLTMEATDKQRLNIETVLSQVRSSTMCEETPKYIAKAYEKNMKRLRSLEDGVDEFEGTSSPIKRRRSAISSPKLQLEGAQKQPVEVSSGETSSEEKGEQEQDENMEDVIQAQLQTQLDEDMAEDTDKLTPNTESGELQYPTLPPLPPAPDEFEPPSSSPYPSNTPTPTPRAPRTKASNFDTQAILSSPSQGLPIVGLPRPPPGFTKAQTQTQVQVELESQSPGPSIEPSSPARKQESISTSLSIQEFRRSLTEANESRESSHSVPPNLTAIPRPRDQSEAPSEASSHGSGDPDPPLTNAEIREYFAEQNEGGFTDEEITAALKHTRCRPNLAVAVLQAWENGKPLPDQRGIWSIEDDKDVESGDGRVLARLEKKHTWDRWGGIVERLSFLEQYRNA